MLKLPSPADGLPLTLGKKLTEAPVKPSEERDLIRHDSRGALWKNCAGGRLQFIPNPSTLGPRKSQAQTPERLQKALDSVGESFKLSPGFRPGDYVRYEHFTDETINHLIGRVVKIEDNKVWCQWSDENFSGPPAYAIARELLPCDAEGWIPHTPGDPMPCDGKVEVFIKLRTNATAYSYKPIAAGALYWDISNGSGITSWKPLL